MSDEPISHATSASLSNAPFDVLFFVADYLSIQDLVNLRRSCRQLWITLDDPRLARKLVKLRAPHSREAALLADNRVSPQTAISKIYQRRTALLTGQPRSATLVGYGKDFLRQGGALCYLSNYDVHVVDLYGANAGRHRIPLQPILQDVTAEFRADDLPALKLMSFAHEIVIIHASRKRSAFVSKLIAVKTSSNIANHERVLNVTPIDNTNRLFVRHDADFMYCGTHTARGAHGHREWELRGVCFEDPAFEALVQLEEFPGTDLGATVAFHIHGCHFYAVTNQGSFDVEEIGWTSFYTCMRFPLREPSRKSFEINKRIYRRQHKDGPINDWWTELSLQVDSLTDELRIVEARKEWLGAGSSQFRAFYNTAITFDDSDMPFNPDFGGPSQSNHSRPLLPQNDVLTRLVRKEDNPNFGEDQDYLPSQVFPEQASFDCGPAHPFPQTSTKFKGYNHSADTFIDIVEDSTCCSPPPPSRSSTCLRLRIGSRLPAPFGRSSSPPVFDPAAAANRFLSYGSRPTISNRYCTHHHRASPITLWPPSGSSTTDPCNPILHSIINASPPRPRDSHSRSPLLEPPADRAHDSTSTAENNNSYSSSRKITASFDEHALIFLTRYIPSGASFASGEGPIVVVGFDSGVNPAVESGVGRDEAGLKWRMGFERRRWVGRQDSRGLGMDLYSTSTGQMMDGGTMLSAKGKGKDAGGGDEEGRGSGVARTNMRGVEEMEDVGTLGDQYVNEDDEVDISGLLDDDLLDSWLE